MSQTTFSVRMDTEVKRQFDDFCKDVGMNASTAFNMFVRQAVRQKGIPFEITMKTDDYAFREMVNCKLEESKEYAKQPDAVKYSKQDFFERVRGELL